MLIKLFKKILSKFFPQFSKEASQALLELNGVLLPENSRGVDVSIVMPSLNQVQYIERALRSIFDQETKISLEVIVMDGGSTDGTLEILSRMASESQGRLRWFSEADDGPAHAVNKALSKSRGDIIGWLNADDLYTAGAIQRSVKAMQKKTDWVMIYGQGEHVDVCDVLIGRYPTQSPSVSLQTFADGCFICQPTVFLRRKTLSDIGGLDESLRTTFDFELWLRIFQKHPGQIGFIDIAQAKSRLHHACITQSQRETVIREGMQVVAQYLGHCPIHWVRTYIDEIFADYPHGQNIENIKEYIDEFISSVAACLSADGLEELNELVKEDCRIQLAKRDACLEIYPDGWLADQAKLRVQAKAEHWGEVMLNGEHVDKGNKPLCLTVHSPDGSKREYRVKKKGNFTLRIALPKPKGVPAYWVYTIESESSFIPRDCEPGSEDDRKLVCRINSLQLIA